MEELPLTLTPREEIVLSPSPEKPVPWGRLIACKTFLSCVDLVNSTFTFGRLESCDAFITSSMVNKNTCFSISKLHFKIEKKDDNLVYITDTSKNGTYINNQLIGNKVTKILKNCDKIAVATGPNLFYIFMCAGSEGVDDHFLPEELKIKYASVKILGRGSCGEVRLVKDRESCGFFAIKKVTKSEKNTSLKHKINHPLKIANEVNILKSLSHPCIIKMIELLEKDNDVYLILEYMAGGELTSKINEKLTEAQVKFYFYQMILAVKYLHCNGVTHRDLKPENILLLDNRPETLLKVTDFGLSKITEENNMTTVCGTLKYIAPEVMSNPHRDYGDYGKEVDIWSLGVILFLMLSNEFPFETEDNDIHSLRTQIVMGTYNMQNGRWKNVTALAKDLVSCMLKKYPKQRISMDDIFKHPWISRDLTMQYRVEAILKENGCHNIKEILNDLEPPEKKFKFTVILSSTSSSDESESSFPYASSSGFNSSTLIY